MTSALRPVMQHVALDEGDARSDERVPSGPQRLRSAVPRLGTWAAHRPARAAVASVVALAVLLAAFVALPRWAGSQERGAVLGAAAFPGAVRPLDSAPRARWSATVDGSVAPVLAGDVVVVAQDAATGRRIVGLDVVAGHERWSVALEDAVVPETVLCRPVGVELVCVVSPLPPTDSRRFVPDDPARPAPPGVGEGVSVLLRIDPADGEVLSRSDVPGWVVATEQVGRDLVVATYAWGMLTVRRVDPTTGATRWSTQRWSTFQSAGSSRVRLVAAGDLVTATGNEVTLLLDATTGDRLPRPDGSSVADQVRLLEDGTLVRTRFRVREAGVDAISELSREGGPPVTVRGTLVQPGVSDGTSGLVFSASGLTGGPLGGRVRAYAPGSAEPVWRALAPAPEVAADVAGRVVVRGGGVLVGLDARTGAQVWRRSFGPTIGRTFTDGEHLVVEREGPDALPALTALSLDDGATVWDTTLPADAPRPLRLGSHLYAVGDSRLVALR
ncbi:outer membrane protein assembly factor BamB family protein [Cellulomonas sp. P5_C5]